MLELDCYGGARFISVLRSRHAFPAAYLWRRVLILARAELGRCLYASKKSASMSEQPPDHLMKNNDRPEPWAAVLAHLASTSDPPP